MSDELTALQFLAVGANGIRVIVRRIFQCAFLRTARKLSRNFGVPYMTDDLIQEGLLALMEAGERVDPSGEASFDVYSERYSAPYPLMMPTQMSVYTETRNRSTPRSFAESLSARPSTPFRHAPALSSSTIWVSTGQTANP